MPNMIPIVYLNENLMDCNVENLAWGKQEPLIPSYMFWYTTKGEKVAKTSFYIMISCRDHNSYIIPNNILH